MKGRNMFDSLVQFFIDHAAVATVTLIVTGLISGASQLDAMVRDAGPRAPIWLRFLSKVLSQVARNVREAKNNQVAKIAVLALIPTLLLMGCASVHEGGVRAGGMAEAYEMTGPSIEVDAEGASTCKSEDPQAEPCTVKYAAGAELWDPIVKTMAVPFEAVLQLFGRTMIPTE